MVCRPPNTILSRTAGSQSITSVRSRKRLLSYWNGPRCCRIWRWPRRECSGDIPAISTQRGAQYERATSRGYRLIEILFSTELTPGTVFASFSAAVF